MHYLSISLVEGRVSGMGSFMQNNKAFALDVAIEEVIIPWKKDGGSGGGSYNGLMMDSKILGALENWNFNQNYSNYRNAVNSNPVDDVQTGLDLMGNIPVFGEVFDGMNSLIYLGRGDRINAAASFSAMIPFAGIGLKYGIKGIGKKVVGEVGSDLIKVRHHTSSMGLKGIKNSGSINASRGLPYGVDVEVAPFVKNAKLGQAGTGSYIEFSVPKSLVGPPAPGYMGGTGTAGRIVTEGVPFNLTGTSPKFVRWNWLGF